MIERVFSQITQQFAEGFRAMKHVAVDSRSICARYCSRCGTWARVTFISRRVTSSDINCNREDLPVVTVSNLMKPRKRIARILADFGPGNLCAILDSKTDLAPIHRCSQC